MTDVVTILALDVGDKRVGLAIANSLARLPHALPTLQRDDLFWQKIQEIITIEDVQRILVGLPRSLDGEDTAQTTLTRAFAKQLEDMIKLPVVLQDEALTSWQAHAELKAAKRSESKGEADALAAVYILEDYLNGQFNGVITNG